MDFVELEQFLQLCQIKNISKAAKTLFLSQQGLSKIIQRWEKELDAPLFARTRNGLELTAYGEIVEKYAVELVGQYRTMRSEIDAARQRNDHLIVTADLGVLSLLTMEPVVAFFEACPQIVLAVQEHTERTNHRMIMERRAELRLGLSTRQTEEYDYIPLWPLQGAVMLSEENPLAKKERLSIEDLKNQNMMACGSTTHYAYTPACEAAGFSPRWILSAVEFLDPKPYLRTNYGICTGFAGYLPQCAPEDHVVIRPMEGTLCWSVGCLMQKGAKLSSAARRFLEHMIRYAKENPMLGSAGGKETEFEKEKL